MSGGVVYRYTYGGSAIMFFVHIIFDGEYLEAQMGKNADRGSHREG